MKAYISLFFSISFELFATAMLKLSNGFSEIVFIVLSLLGYGLSFFFLGMTLKKIPLSIAYAIWSGVGTATTVIISIIFFNEILTLSKFMGIISIIVGVVFLNLSEEK